MNLGEAKARALSLMSEYSIDGSLISESENADYLNRMTRFASDAQMEIADKLGVNAVVEYTATGSSESGYQHFPLPDDFRELRKVMKNGEQFTDYSVDFRYFTLRKSEVGTFELFYFKNPQELAADTPDTYEFEVPKHAHTLIPYFVAAMAITEEKPSIGDRLLNIYFSRLGAISKKNDVFLDEIKIVYRM